MIGRGGALLLAAVLGLNAAHADDAQAPAAAPGAPSTTTSDAPPPVPDAPPPSPDVPPSVPNAPSATPDAPPSPAADVPLPAAPEPAQPGADASPDAPKEAAPAEAPKEEPKEVPKEAPKEAPKDVVQPPKNLEPIPKDTAITVLGKKVLGPEGEDMGRVTDLLLDRDGHIKSIVIDFGGFLGVGSRKIAIDWRLVRFVPDKPDAPIALSLGKVEVQAAPEYKDSAQPPVMVGPPPSAPDAAR